MEELVRLQKFIAGAGVCSRRKAEELISAGKVKVNGVRVTELGTKVDPDTDSVEVDGKLIRHYSHMYAPDEYYRDAFTDEIISCGDVYATNYSEEYGL
ncbi:MAG: hypothetical protein IJF61_06730, partial [Clostridia bacterium]|nr:hypothetical protein [Clostridia bacterium]